MHPSPAFSHDENLPAAVIPRGAGQLSYRYAGDISAPAEDLVAHDLGDYWKSFLRRKWTIVLCTLAGVALGIVSIIPMAQIYSAHTTIEVQGLNENFMGAGAIDPQGGAGNYSATEYNIQTQIKILSSDTISQRVREKLASDALPFTPPQSDIFSPLRNRLRVLPQDPLTFVRMGIDMASVTLNARSIQGTRIIEVRCDSVSPEVAAAFANMAAAEYVEQNSEARSKNAQQTNLWLVKKLQDMKLKLEESENRLQNFVRESGLLFVAQQDTLADSKLRQLQTELSAIQSDRIAKQSRFEMASTSPPESLPDILDDGSLRQYQASITELRRQLAETSTALTPAHYRVQRIQAQIDEMESALKTQRENILRRIKNEFDASQRRERLLLEAYGAQSKMVASQLDKASQYNILKREVEINQQLYNSMLHQVNVASVASAMPTNNVRIIDPATPSSKPIRPNIYLNSGLGMAAGLLIGCGLAFLLEQSSKGLVLPGKSGGLMRAPELGVIPSAKAPARTLGARWRPGLAKRSATVNGRASTPLDENAKRVELVSWYDRPSIVAESFRVTLASLMLGDDPSKNPRVMVLASPGPQEGKTTIACNIAIAMAEIGRKVLLIDADLRRPRLHDVFDLPNSWGLSDLIQEQTPISQYPIDALMRPTKIPGVHVLPSGPATLSITSLFYSQRLSTLLERFRREFDAVLIDSSPLLQFSDARIIGKMSDGIILVLRSGVTDRTRAVAARQRLEEDGTLLLGTILNDWNSDGREKDYDGYYSHYYQTKRDS